MHTCAASPFHICAICGRIPARARPHPARLDPDTRAVGRMPLVHARRASHPRAGRGRGARCVHRSARWDAQPHARLERVDDVSERPACVYPSDASEELLPGLEPSTVPHLRVQPLPARSRALRFAEWFKPSGTHRRPGGRSGRIPVSLVSPEESAVVASIRTFSGR